MTDERQRPELHKLVQRLACLLIFCGRYVAEHQLFAGRKIDVPCTYIAGASDWGTYQKPGELKAMITSGCTRMLGVHLVEGAGHWIQQEQAQVALSLIDAFLRETA